MLRLTLSQMRLSAGRLVAAGIAIMLGTAFVASTLMAMGTMERTTHDAMTATFADADLVLDSQMEPLTDATLDEIRGTAGVVAADALRTFGLAGSANGSSEYITVAPVASHARLALERYVSGTAPTAPGESAISADVAERLGLALGDNITMSWTTYLPVDPAHPDADTWEDASAEFHVVGLLPAPANYWSPTPPAVVSPDQMSVWEEANSPEGGVEYWRVLIAGEPGTDLGQLRNTLEALVPGTSVTTVDEQADILTEQLTGNRIVFTVLLLGFAAVALSVAGLVIANTFQVLVAQRTRSLALLRCVGASKDQVRSSVLIEAAVLGFLSSVAGLALGYAVVVAGLALISKFDLNLPLDGKAELSVATVIVVLATGTLVTLIAALVPARMATRVAPLAALRPIEGEPTRSSGRLRAVIASVLLVGGLAGLVGGVALMRSSNEVNAESLSLIALALGVLGGLASLTGLLVGAVFVVPRLIRVAGRLLPAGAPGRIATANAARNPRRTAATSSALLIGVALVTMMSTGALAARQSLGDALDTQYPVDLAVDVGMGSTLTPGQADAVRSTPGIGDVALLRSAQTEVTPWGPMDVAAVAEGSLVDVLRDRDLAESLTDTSVIVPEALVSLLEVKTGDTLTVGSGTAAADLTVVASELGGFSLLVTDAVLSQLDPSATANLLWGQLADGAAEEDVMHSVQETLTDLSAVEGDEASVPQVSGAALERAAYQQIIDTLLSVVLGLLAVAVVIALIGVANTLSLSVLERRRESALLRAMGLTRGQLRQMLAIEGVLIAAVGAFIGIIAGMIYGWAGSAIVIGMLGDVAIVVPWRDIAIVTVVAIGAGLLASVIPARSAVRTPPVAALAMD